MGKKKGGAKNKLARMSEEEKARYLQHRADIEEEARRRKQQLICLYMKNKLKREEAFSRLNLAKINQEWRSILRQIKCQELRNELIEVEKFFQNALEQKNRIIRRLLSDLDEAEDMYSTLKQSHMENIERLMSIQEQRLDHFRAKFIKEKDTILSSWNNELEKYRTDRDKSQCELESVFYGFNEIIKKDAIEQEENHLEKFDDIRSEMTIKLENIAKSREMQLEQLWKEYQNVINDYVKYIETFYNEYIDLRENDDENTELIRQHCYEITKSTDHITELKLILIDATDEYDFQINYLENMKINLNEQFFNMKQNLKENLKINEKQFKYMTVTSHSVLKYLEKILQKGETVLQLSKTCRKYETEYEKILPFGFSRRKICDISKEELKDPPNDFKENTVELLMNLENFWIRVNNAQLDTVCLKEEKSEINNQNNHLMKLLKDYLIEMTLDNGNTSNAENRLLNRPQSMRIEKILHINLNDNFNKRYTYKNSKKKRPVTCIEGNLSNAIRTKNLTNNKNKLDNIIQEFESIKIFNNF